MSRVGFQPTILVSELSKTLHALDHAPIAIDPHISLYSKIAMVLHDIMRAQALAAASIIYLGRWICQQWSSGVNILMENVYIKELCILYTFSSGDMIGLWL